VGRKGVEPLTFRLSVERSTKLSYRPVEFLKIKVFNLWLGLKALL
jgi:hypothetical protein